MRGEPGRDGLWRGRSGSDLRHRTERVRLALRRLERLVEWLHRRVGAEQQLLPSGVRRDDLLDQRRAHQHAGARTGARSHVTGRMLTPVITPSHPLVRWARAARRAEGAPEARSAQRSRLPPRPTTRAPTAPGWAGACNRIGPTRGPRGWRAIHVQRTLHHRADQLSRRAGRDRGLPVRRRGADVHIGALRRGVRRDGRRAHRRHFIRRDPQSGDPMRTVELSAAFRA